MWQFNKYSFSVTKSHCLQWNFSSSTAAISCSRTAFNLWSLRASSLVPTKLQRSQGCSNSWTFRCFVNFSRLGDMNMHLLQGYFRVFFSFSIRCSVRWCLFRLRAVEYRVSHSSQGYFLAIWTNFIVNNHQSCGSSFELARSGTDLIKLQEPFLHH